VGVHESGRREVLGLDVVTGEDGAGWLAFPFVACEPEGSQAANWSSPTRIPGYATRSQPSCAARAGSAAARTSCGNLLVRVPKSAQSLVATLVRSIFMQPDAESVHAQRARIVEQLTPRFAEAAKMLADADEILAFTAFPKEHWRQIWSNNPQGTLES
jgi:transposase-like protein